MTVHKNIVSQNDIESILLHYREGESDSYMKRSHGYQIDKLINYSNLHYCDKDNLYLRKVVDKIVKQDEIIYSIHIVSYKAGDWCEKHIDRSSFCTYIFMLSDGYTGGDLLVDGVNTYATKGDVVVFNGNVEYHEVTKVIDGVREVMVVWTGGKRKEQSLI